MNTTDLGTQRLYAALLAHFLYMGADHVDHRISHQLMNNANALKAQYGISDTAYYAVATQAQADADKDLDN